MILSHHQHNSSYSIITLNFISDSTLLLKTTDNISNQMARKGDSSSLHSFTDLSTLWATDASDYDHFYQLSKIIGGISMSPRFSADFLTPNLGETQISGFSNIFLRPFRDFSREKLMLKFDFFWKIGLLELERDLDWLWGDGYPPIVVLRRLSCLKIFFLFAKQPRDWLTELSPKLLPPIPDKLSTFWVYWD